MNNPVQFWTDCYLDGMSVSKCDQLTSAIFDIDGDVLSRVSDSGLAESRKEYARMETNQCAS